MEQSVTKTKEEILKALEGCQTYGSRACASCPYSEFLGEKQNCIERLHHDAVSLVNLLQDKTTSDLTWHKWPDEKPEDFIDSSVPKGMLEWKVLCLTVSQNNKIFMQYRRRSIFPSDPYWANCDPKFWMIVPKFEDGRATKETKKNG